LKIAIKHGDSNRKDRSDGEKEELGFKRGPNEDEGEDKKVT
jgi:hypothetical protein